LSGENGIVVGAEVERAVARTVGRAAVDPLPHDAVRLEDAIQPAELRGHVGDGEAHVGREPPGGVAAVLDGALHRDGVAAEVAERAQDDVLAADAERRLAHVLDADRVRHLDPRLAEHHRRGHVGAAQADRERAEAAVRARVRIRAEDDVAGEHEIPIELRVEDRDVGVVEVLDAALARERPRQLGQLLGARVAGERRRVDGVVHREEEPRRIVELRPAELGVGLVHTIPRQLARDGPINANRQDVPRLDPGPRKTHRVVREDLLRERHGFSHSAGSLPPPLATCF